MYVTQHAHDRLRSRMGRAADMIVSELEALPGERGTVAYVLADMDDRAYAPDGSNGELLVVLVVDGSVETVYYRRHEQDMDPAYFGAHKVVDLRRYHTQREGA